jgi:PAS domain S-box-containing protein
MKSASRTSRSAAFLFLALLFVLVSQESSASTPRQNVLILFPNESNVPGFINFEAGFRSALAASKNYQFEFYVECMDLTRFPDQRYHDKLMELLREKYSELKMDLIVATTHHTLEFLARYSPESFLDVPVIAYSQDLGLLKKAPPVPVAAMVNGRLDMEGTLALAIRLHPDTHKVFVVAGASPYDRELEAVAREALRGFESQVELVYLSGVPMDELINRTSSLPEHSLLFYISIFRDGDGRTFKSPQALALISQQANAPIYSLSETYIDSGIVGGHLISHYAHGAKVGKVALRILNREPSDNLGSSEGSENRYMFDARQLKRWGISEENLPPGSDIRYREFSIWGTYQWQIVGVASVVFLQALLISALVISLRKQRRIGRALREAEAKYRTVADFTYDWEYWTAPDGIPLYVSPSCKRITGYAYQDFIDNPSLFRDVIVLEDREFWDGHDHDSRMERESQGVQFRIRSIDGNIRWIEHVCRPVINERGEFLGIRASNRDITERKDSEFEAQRHQEELAHVIRIVTIGELATSLAHEINQPLTAIRCNAEAARRFLAGATPDLNEVRTILDDIIQDDGRAGEVIRRIRAMVKKEPLRREEVVLNDAVQESIALVRSASFLAGFSITTELDIDLPTVQGDRVQLQQVVLNLLLNATAAMRDTAPGSRKLIVTTARQDGRTVMVSVRDSGTGIHKNAMGHLFEPFFTTKADGLGMGLSISRTIIKAHGGTIGAENNPEGGATFYFTLPVERGGQP